VCCHLRQREVPGPKWQSRERIAEKSSYRDIGFSVPLKGCMNFPACGLPTRRERISPLAAYLACGNEFHRKRIDAVAGVGWSETLAHEDVAQVSAATGALDLDPVTVAIG
jgi:hypothetical protein